MDVVQWQNIIIEWVNCLNLTEAIKSINDLKNGDFFKQLLNILSQDKSDSFYKNVNHLIDFLKKHYPAYGLEDESSVSEDTKEIMYAYSLLLHFCCIQDGREDFLSPLCKSLNIASQVSIKTFLEDLQYFPEITRDVLKNAICKIDRKHATPIKPSSFNDSVNILVKSPSSPLYKFLKTPFKIKFNLEERAKEVKTLRNQLDLERLEKVELQEELNLQYEKTKKLDKYILEKQQEISKLRTELLTIETGTPPSSDENVENVQEKKRLKAEIVSLENYISILHKEQEEIQNERDKARNKLRRSEEACNEWQEKAIQAERQIEEISRENENYDLELKFFRERCEELSSMLQELNPQTNYDESYETDNISNCVMHNKSNSTIDCESLARTVVEIQLIEVQEENKILRKQLTELECNSQELSANFSKIQTDFQKIREENTKLEINNNSLQEKISSLIENQEEVSKMKTKVENELVAALKENEIINANLTTIQKRFEAFKTENENLVDDLKSINGKNDIKIDELNIQLHGLVTIKTELQTKLKDAVDKALHFEKECDSLKNVVDQVNRNIDKCISSFEKQIQNNIKDEFKKYNTVSKVQKLIDVLEIKNLNDVKNIAELQKKCNNLSSQISNLEQEIAQLNINEVTTKNQVEQLKETLNKAESKIQYYENNVIIDYEKLLDKYKSVIDEKNGMINELSKLKDIFCSKEKYINQIEEEKLIQSQKICLLEQNLLKERQTRENLQQNYHQLEKIIETRENYILVLEEEKLNLKNTIDLLNQQILTEINSSDELNDKIIKLESLIFEKETELSMLIEEKSLLLKNLHNLEVTNKKLKENQDILETTNKTLNEDVIKTQNSLEDSKEKIKVLEDDIKNVQSLKLELERSYDSTQIELKDKKNFIKSLQAELKSLEKQFKDIKTDLSKKEIEKDNLENKWQQVNKNLDESLFYIKDLECERTDLQQSIVILNQKNQNLDQNLLKSSEQKHAIEKQLLMISQKYEIDSNNMQLRMEEQVSKIEQQANQITDMQKEIHNLEECIATINKDLFNISNLLINKFDNINSQEFTVESLNTHLCKLKQQIETLLIEKQESSEEIKSYVEQINNCKHEYNSFVKQLDSIIFNINSNLSLQSELKFQGIQGESDNEVEALENLKKSQIDEELKMNFMSEKILDLQKNIYNLVLEKHLIKSEYKSLQEKYNIVDSLKREIEAKNVELEAKTSQEIIDLTNKLRYMQSENMKFSKKIDSYHKKITDTQTALLETQVALENVFETHRIERENHQEKILQLEEENVKLENQLEYIKNEERNRKSELLSAKNNLEEAIKNYETSVENNAASTYQQQKEINTLQKKLRKLTGAYEKFQKTYFEIQKNYEQTEIEVLFYAKLNNDLENQLSILKTENINMKDNYKRQLDSLTSERESLKYEIKNLCTEYAKSKNTIKDLKEKMKSEEIKYKKLIEQISVQETNYYTKIQKITQILQEKEKDIKSLNFKLKYIEGDQVKLDNLREELANISESKVEEIKKEHEKIIDSYKDEIATQNKHLEKTNQTLSQLEEERNKLSNEMTRKITEKELLIEKIKKENVELKENLNVLMNDKISLTAELESVNQGLKETESNRNMQIKEMEDTKTYLTLTLKLIENIKILLTTELKISEQDVINTEKSVSNSKKFYSCELKIKNNLVSKLQQETETIKEKIEEMMQLKNETQSHLEEIIKKYETLENEKILQLVEYESNIESIKLESEEIITQLKSSNNEIIQSLEKQIIQKDNTIKDQLEQMEILNVNVEEKVDEILNLQNEKTELLTSLKSMEFELFDLREKHDELKESQKNISKEVENNILKAHESVVSLKSDFNKQLEKSKNEKLTEAELNMKLENYLEIERSRVKLLETKLAEVTSDKEKFIEQCSISYSQIHKILTETVEEKHDIEFCDEIDLLKKKQTDLENTLALILIRKQQADKEVNIIIQEIKKLKEIKKELSNYETIKSDCTSLQNKCEVLSACELENNKLKSNVFELETKILYLQTENLKNQEKISEKEIKYKEMKAKFLEEINSLKTASNEYLQGLNSKENDIVFLKDRNNNLQSVINDLNEKLHLNQQELEDTVTDLEILKQKYNLVSKKLPLQETEIKDLNNKITNYKSIIESLEIKNQDIYESHNTLLTQHKELESKYQQSLDSHKEEIIRFENKNNKCDNLIKKLSLDNQELNRNYLQLKEQSNLLEKRLQDFELERKDEMQKFRTIYSQSMTENSCLQLDCTVMKKTIDERNSQITELMLIKDAYEKLVEENNKVLMELDTLRYKRNRDKEEFQKMVDDETKKASLNAEVKIQEIKNMYEEKLNKMKEKIIKLYKEELDKEKQKVSTRQENLSQANETISTLKSQLWHTSNKYVDLKKDNEQLRQQLQSLKENVPGNSYEQRRDSVSSRRTYYETDRRASTLSRDSRLPQVDIIEEKITISRRRQSFGMPSNRDQGLQMEDEEGELFNNTYLSDLKAGRCIENDRESNSNRLSELQYRNSLCPPHLKSSYPAETQFTSPGQFKEDDIKMGSVDLDDSMSSSLLPSEKPRMKKDWGQTMYKKPGPPTPSKNGGRLSLQGNEVHPRDVLREQNDNKPQGVKSVSTPSRIRALFTRSGSNRNDSENTTPTKGKRRNFFHR